MYKCQKCNEFSKPNEKQHRETVEVRKKRYLDVKHMTAGEGFEIVREITICPRCIPKNPVV